MKGKIRVYGMTLSSVGLLILRLVVGLVFSMHGGQKLLARGIPSVASALDQLGMTPPDLWAVVLVIAELGGGLALMLGVLTRFAALILGISMVVAIASLLWARGFFLPGYEFALTLLGGSLTLAFTGPGRFAVDHYLGLEP
jgi:putative oxidoreductase